MNKYLLGAIGVIAGAIIGSVLNMGIVSLGHYLIPPPVSFDPNDMESLKAAMPHFKADQFIFPFLAHALGTLLGGTIATLIYKHSPIPALIVGLLFFIGGIMAISMLPSPTWFNATDLIFAYFPAAYLGYRIARLRKT